MTASDFKCLFLPCHKQMYWVAMRLTANTAEAEDLVQEAFMRLWLKRNDIHDLESPLSFGIRTMRNIFIDKQRRRHIEERDCDPASIVVKENSTADSNMIAAETMQRVLLLIEKLPEQQRRIITMKDLEGYTFEQIAQQTGLSEAGVRTSLSRARQTIRQQFKTNNEDETI